MITVQPLETSQYRQVAEWEFHIRGDVDWEKYEAEMNDPQWRHFAMYIDSEFVGALSFERIDRQMLAYHVVTARHKLQPQALAEVLLKSAGILFNQGFTALTARIPRENRAAAKLAIRCRMREWGHTPSMRFFILTPSRFYDNRRTN
jgi:hypothetical protein